MYNEDVCRRFYENPKVNPITGKRLQYGKGPYLKFVENCGDPNIIKAKKPIEIEEPREPKEVNQLLIPEAVILENILLDNQDIQNFVTICGTNKRYQELCKNDIFWLRLYEKYYGNTDMVSVVKFTTWYDLVFQENCYGGNVNIASQSCLNCVSR
jgi:hypothetical protein